MEYKKIGLLEWLGQNVGKVKYDLASGFVKPISLKEFGITSPDIDIVENKENLLCEILSKRYDVKPKNIFITNGATCGLYLLYCALFETGDECILEVPNYEPLYRLGSLFGLRMKILERTLEDDFQIDLEELQRRISRATKAIIVTNLHDPSGVATEREKLITIGQIARDYKAYVIVDEVYLDSAFNSHRPSATYGSNFISINSLSKVYGLPGLRVGWIITNDETLINKLQRISGYISPRLSLPAYSIACIALQKRDFILERTKTIISENIKIISDWISKEEKLRWVKPDGGTVAFVKLPPLIDDIKLSTLLRENFDTLVVPGYFFWAKGFIRISFGQDSKILVNGLASISSAIAQLRRR
jgi:hypothetical protein